MKENTINYQGIKTNNLKNISLEIPKGAFWGIGGPSGSGKSSLAYSTIFAISQFEWEKVTNHSSNLIPTFNIEKYQNVVPAIALKQENFNTNPRSTIATFFKVDKDFRLLFASCNNLSPSLFSFNNPKNCCPFCEGLGVETSLSSEQMINWDKSILGEPFVPWKKSYKQKVLEKYANDNNIPLEVPLKILPKEQLDLLLNSKSEKKYKVTYTISGKKRTKEFYFIGLLSEMQVLKEDKKHISSHQKILDYSTTNTCSHCNGSRFSEKVLTFKYNFKNIGDLYLMEFSELLDFINNSILIELNSELKHLLINIKRIITGLVESNLDYLQLNRGIPSLSGGELQRIRLCNILTSQISGMIYIVDEPSSRLHVSEYNSVLQALLNLRDNQNTILMIEHNPYFLSYTDKNFFLGPGSGNDGGNLVSKESDNANYLYKCRELSNFLKFKNITRNNIINLSFDLPLNCIIGIYGPSGSGKSTLAKYISENTKKSEYVSQKPIKGTVASTVASYSGIFEEIRECFSKISGCPANFFSFSNTEGQCPYCSGRGSIKYTLDFGKTEVEIICEECKGKRFNTLVLEYKYKNLSIYEILTLTIDALIKGELFLNHPLNEKLYLLQKLGLGYLNLFRTTDTLSGGEAQRLKLTKYIGKKSNDRIFIFDEPLSGLSQKDALNILRIFNDLVKKGSTVIFIEHNVIGIDYSDYIIEMGPGKGKYGGKIIFEGKSDSFIISNQYNIYKKHSV